MSCSIEVRSHIRYGTLMVIMRCTTSLHHLSPPCTPWASVNLGEIRHLPYRALPRLAASFGKQVNALEKLVVISTTSSSLGTLPSKQSKVGCQVGLEQLLQALAAGRSTQSPSVLM